VNRTPEDHRAVEERLRAALADRAAHIEPSPDGLDRIEEELMNEAPTNTSTSTSTSTSRRWIVGGLSAAAAILLVVVGLVVLGDDDERGVVADSTSTTTESTTTTSEGPTTTTSDGPTTTALFVPDVDPYAVAFPSPTTSRRFDSPEPAAQAYATEVLGFTELEMGEYLAGDSRSGEVEISDRPGGQVTVILLRQMEDDTWFVLGSNNGDIVVDQPEAGGSVQSPFTTSGQALAFEGTVNVYVLAQDDAGPLGEGFVTGSGSPPAGPFEGEISFTAPAGDTPGILVYRTFSAEDGHVQQATSFPVRLVAG
jgi:hypothetical protein